MLGLGLGLSHAPSMFRPVTVWPEIHRRLTEGVPQPPEFHQETEEVLEAYHRRIERGFSELREQIEAYGPDALLIVGDDQGELFSGAHRPTFCLFTGEEVRGSVNISLAGENEAEIRGLLLCRNGATGKCHALEK